ncbi:MAG: 50S ribosomal protein L13 [Candidatus Sericytochromatia bacterium]|nr:50S ribosomal protein L13 [Candidatus Sericytochromatia bacterium]
MKTFMPTTDTRGREWVHIDAEGKTLGRLASAVADILRGKNKPTFTPHLDCGDFVIITNADKIKVTGNKLKDKIYHRHSGYPGGHKQINLEKLLKTHPDRVLEKAIKGMLPHNRLGDAQYGKLNIYNTPDHPHVSQKPRTLELSDKGELLSGN